MPTPKSERSFTPIPGAQYQILHTKVGPDEDDLVYGQVVDAEEYPEVDFERLAKAKSPAVRRVDAAYQIEQINTTAPAQPDPNVVVLAQPHREFGPGDPPVVTPETPMVTPEKSVI